jgi:pilus assembly protein CpaB
VTDVRDLAERAVDTVGGPRRLMSAGLVAIATLAALHAARPAPPATTLVWVAARDLSGGAPLSRTDVRAVRLPLSAAPSGALRDATALVGHLLAAPVRRGEPITDVRLLGQPLLSALSDPGLVAVPVRVADGSAAAALVRAGDLVDVLAASDPTDGSGAMPVVVARAVRVLAVPGRDVTAGDGGGLVVVAVDRAQAGTLARASVSAHLSLALRRG